MRPPRQRRRNITARTQPPSDSDMEVTASSCRRHRDNQIQFFTIAEVAERLHVATRTVRRWIEAGHLVAHRIGGVVRLFGLPLSCGRQEHLLPVGTHVPIRAVRSADPVSTR